MDPQDWLSAFPALEALEDTAKARLGQGVTDL